MEAKDEHKDEGKAPLDAEVDEEPAIIDWPAALEQVREARCRSCARLGHPPPAVRVHTPRVSAATTASSCTKCSKNSKKRRSTI